MTDDGSNEEEVVIRLRGLPWSATEEDIVKFFDDMPIRNGIEGVHITLSREGRPSGEAYVELEDAEDVSRAEKKHNQHMGRRYIEVFKAKRSEMEWVIKRASTGPGNEDDCCLRLRGLPYGCSKEEIMQFFSGLEIVPNGIALPTDYQGRHTGEAYVQFVSKDMAQKGMQKHKEKIAHRYIEIFKSNLSEIRAAMSPKMRGPIGSFSRPTPYDSRDRFGGMNRYSMGRGRGNYNDYDDGPGWGSGFSDSWVRGGRMGGTGSVGLSALGMKAGFGGGRSLGGGSPGGTGHCVHMRGLPFRASELDIADFFRPLNPVRITIQMDNSNRPSGEADVEFATHDDAVKAMSKDKAHMQHRYIELFLNSTPGHGMGGPMSSGLGPMGGGSNFGQGGFGSGGYGSSGRIGGGRGYDDSLEGGISDGMLMESYNGFGSGRFGPRSRMSGNSYSSFC